MNNSKLLPNTNQSKAILWNDGPALVLAGPGAGKTFVLTKRVIRLISESPDEWFNVLALTFTNRAAEEMKERVGNRLGPERARVEISTFHGFCVAQLRQHGSHIGIRPDFRLLTQDSDRIAVLRDLERSDTPFAASSLPVEKKARLLSHLMRSGATGDEMGRSLLEVPATEWITCYLEVLSRENSLDFDSLLFCCLRLLQRAPAVARLVRTTYAHVCVDEYQDTNAAQDRILRLICPPPRGNLFAVADDDQIIYEWNGASPERLRALGSDYGMREIYLPDSYRCPDLILRRANRLIRHNRNRLRTPHRAELASAIDHSATIRSLAFGSEGDEVKWVARDIQRRQVASDRCAVMTRTTKLAQLACDALGSIGVPACHVQGWRGLESPGVRFVAAALHLAAAPTHTAQLRQVCRSFFEATGVRVPVERAAGLAETNGGALLAGFTRAAPEAEGGSRARALLEAVEECLVERANYRDFIQLSFDSYRSETLKPSWTADIIEATELEMAHWRQVEKAISDRVSSSSPLSQYLQDFELRSGAPEPEPGQVQCLTIFQAKGKGFANVYVLGLAEDLMPSFYAKGGRDEERRIEEERRICFVAITRASETLTLTRARSYFGWRKAPSRFLAEMGLIEEGPARTAP